MNLLKAMQSRPVLSGIAAVVASVGLFAGIMHAWGPVDRTTFTIDKPATYVTFNSITDNPNYGDERNFSIVKDAASTSAADWKDTITVEPGKEYMVRIYVHNNAADNLNLVAENTRASVNLPTTTAKSIQIDSFISADNANPEKVWDQVTLTSDQDFNLAYVAGSAKYTNNLYPQGVALGEDLFMSPGALLGYKQLDGKIPGCFKYSGYVTFKVKPQFAKTADFTMSKQVRKHSTTTGGWTENYAAQPGETVDFLIQYKNSGQTTMNDVVVKDTLPAGLEYVAGSTVLANGNYPTGKTVSDTIVSSTGINIGTYAPSLTAWVRFSAKVVANDKLATCGLNTIKNIASVESDYGNKTDDATVTVEKKCDTTPADNDVEVCVIATKTIKTIKESELKARPSLYADKDSNKCKDIKVCEISSKTVITVTKEQYNTHKSDYADEMSEICHPVNPSTPEDETPAPVAELPKTGFGLSAMSLIGAGALTYAAYAYAASRRM